MQISQLRFPFELTFSQPFLAKNLLIVEFVAHTFSLYFEPEFLM
ncbi:hypothetical protein VCJ_000071 [Vibrio metoecus]|nr:hypothetical protein VCJ_000071 [Vibrio metoecus]